MMVPGDLRRQEAGLTRFKTVKTSSLFFLLVVLQVAQDPSRWSQDCQSEHAQSHGCFNRPDLLSGSSSVETSPLSDSVSPQERGSAASDGPQEPRHVGVVLS